MSRKNEIPASDTFTIAKKQIDEGTFSFFMRNKTQVEYHPSRVAKFTEKRYEIAYTLQDMAGLCTSPEISHFITGVVHRLRDARYDNISSEEMTYVVKFIRHGRDKYENSDYVELSEMV